jgi:hypothetical protein
MQDKIRELTVEELPEELTEEQLDWVSGGSALVTGTHRTNHSFRSDDHGNFSTITH